MGVLITERRVGGIDAISVGSREFLVIGEDPGLVQIGNWLMSGEMSEMVGEILHAEKCGIHQYLVRLVDRRYFDFHPGFKLSTVPGRELAFVTNLGGCDELMKGWDLSGLWRMLRLCGLDGVYSKRRHGYMNGESAIDFAVVVFPVSEVGGVWPATEENLQMLLGTVDKEVWRAKAGVDPDMFRGDGYADGSGLVTEYVVPVGSQGIHTGLMMPVVSLVPGMVGGNA